MKNPVVTRRKFIVSGLEGLAWAALKVRGAPAPAGVPVSGQVRDRTGSAPMAGVAVSNGYSIVETDRQGRYEIVAVPDDYPFIFVTPPAGYAPAGSHFVRLRPNRGARVDFNLVRDPRRTGRVIRLALVSDSHIGTSTLPNFASEDELAADYRAIIAEDAPDLIVNAGDITNEGRIVDFQAALRAGSGLPVPLFNTYGNHDSDADRTAAGGVIDRTNNLQFQAVMGPDQYAFDWGRFSFRCLWHDLARRTDPAAPHGSLARRRPLPSVRGT